MSPYIKKINFYVLTALMTMPLMAFSLTEIPQLEQSVSHTEVVETNVIRAAIDIGSGATKLKVAEVNLKTKKIEQVLAVENYSVQYQDALMSSPDHMFTEKVMQEGIDALNKAKAVATSYGATKVVAVATAAFRTGKNAQEFVDRIYSETGIKVYVIDQDLEGILNFEAAAAEVPFAQEDIVVWDIGGGSYQFTALDKDGKIMVNRGTDASIPFRNRVITEIKRQDIEDTKTPNPISPNQMNMTTSHAREIAEKVDAVFKEKIQDSNTKVIGVGNIFAYNIHPIVCKQSPYDQGQLNHGLQKLVGKTDLQVGGGDYANVYITNPALIMGFMQTLGIDEVYIEDISNADGALVYPEFWE